MTEAIDYTPDMTEDYRIYYEPISCRYFVSTDEKVNKAIDDANNLYSIKREPKLILNDWFDMLGIHRIDLGEHVAIKLYEGRRLFRLDDEVYDPRICRNVKSISGVGELAAFY